MTAVPPRQAGLSRLRALLVTLLSGLAEPAAASAALLIMQDVSSPTSAFSSAVAVGAMVYITVDEPTRGLRTR